jgi:hypothetical protein
MRSIKDINYQLAVQMRQSFGQIEVVQMPLIRKCFICKRENAIR